MRGWVGESLSGEIGKAQKPKRKRLREKRDKERDREVQKNIEVMGCGSRGETMI